MPAEIHEVRRPPLRPGDRVEVALSCPSAPGGPQATAAGVLLCGPQPFLGGDLDNNVLRALATGLAVAGRPVLRFNYRSVGASHPADPDRARWDYWRAVAEEGDTQRVLEDVAEARARAERFFPLGALAGYSFGAWVALAEARRTDFAGPLILVAPPTAHDFTGLAERTAPTLVVLAGADELDTAGAPDALLRDLAHADVHVVADADHFFRGLEEAVALHVLAFLGTQGRGADNRSSRDRSTQARSSQAAGGAP